MDGGIMVQPKESPDARQAEVTNRVDAIGSTVGAIAEAVGALEDRLVHVTRSASSDIVPDRPREAYETSLAQTIDLAVATAENAHERLHSILRRLEV